MMPPVDPWAGQDTPWDPLPPTPPGPALPPTLPGPALPPTPAGPPARSAPPPPRAQQPPAPINRLPVAPRPTTPVPAPPSRGRGPAPVWRPPGPPAPGTGRSRPPQRPLPPPPRRRPRWGRRFAVFTLFTVACCCGLPVAYAAWPPARQYPVRAVLPADVADLRLRDDAASRESADQVFAGVYGDGYGKRVTLFGATGFRLNPALDVRSELGHLAGRYAIRDARSFDLGESGAHERCGVGVANGTPVVVCAWADHGSVAAVVLTRRSVPDSARLTRVLRGAVLKHA